MQTPTPPPGTGPTGQVRRSPDGVTVVAVARWGSTHLRWHVVGEELQLAGRQTPLRLQLDEVWTVNRRKPRSTQ